MLSWLVPKEKQILDLIESEAANLLKAAEILDQIMTDYSRLEGRWELIKSLEHNGDAIAHNIYEELNKTFITPIDREDISALASALDNVLDGIDGLVDRLILWKVPNPTKQMIELVKHIHNCTKEIQYVISKIRDLKNTEDLIRHTRTIDRFEHDADTIYRTAVAELFETGNAVRILKMKEIYEKLEDSVDMCVDVADIVEDIILKNK